MKLAQFLLRHHHKSKDIPVHEQSYSSSFSDSSETIAHPVFQENQLTKQEPIDTISSIDNSIHKINKEGNLEKVERMDHIKKQKAVKRNGFIEDLNYLSIGYFISTPIVVGVVLGIVIDKALRIHGNTYTIIFLIIGALGSIYNIFSLTKPEKK